VGWNLPDGTVRSFLIRPLPGWTHWCERAEAVHGIRRSELLAEGISAGEICAMLCRDLEGQDVYADGGLLDRDWMSQLLKAGECPSPAFRLCDCCAWLFFPDMPVKKKEALQEQARKSAGRRHRAGSDVRWFLEWLRLGREAGYREDVPGSRFLAKTEAKKDGILTESRTLIAKSPNGRTSAPPAPKPMFRWEERPRLGGKSDRSFEGKVTGLLCCCPMPPMMGKLWSPPRCLQNGKLGAESTSSRASACRSRNLSGG